MVVHLPEHAYASDRPAASTHATSPATMTTGWRGDRCPVINKQPLHSRDAAKMSLHIRIGPETVLAAHAQSPPASDSHYPAREDSARREEGGFVYQLPVANRFFWMHGEFLCLLFLRFKRAAFYQGLKSKVGLAAAKAAALRVQGCSIVAAPMHAPSRTSLLLPLLLSHNLSLSPALMVMLSFICSL
jgi:hypothetical protein